MGDDEVDEDDEAGDDDEEEVEDDEEEPGDEEADETAKTSGTYWLLLFMLAFEG